MANRSEVTEFRVSIERIVLFENKGVAGLYNQVKEGLVVLTAGADAFNDPLDFRGGR